MDHWNFGRGWMSGLKVNEMLERLGFARILLFLKNGYGSNQGQVIETARHRE
jgi:hypothetical protein